LQKIRAEIVDEHDETTCDEYEEGYMGGLEKALAIIDYAIEPSAGEHDFGRPVE